MTLDELRRDKDSAERLLSDDFFKRSLSRLREEYTRLWMHAQTPEARELLHVKVTQLDDLVKAIAWPIGELKVREANSARGIREQATGEPI